MSSSDPFGGGGGRPEAGGVAAPLAQGAQGSDGAADQPVVPDLLLLRAAHRLLAQDHSGRHCLMVSNALQRSACGCFAMHYPGIPSQHKAENSRNLGSPALKVIH